MTNINIGELIDKKLKEQRRTRAELGQRIGKTGALVSYLISRKTIDVGTLRDISVALDYDFFQHYSIAKQKEAGDREGLRNRVNELEKELSGLNKNEFERLQRENEMLRQENGYLKEINGLLKKKNVE